MKFKYLLLLLLPVMLMSAKAEKFTTGFAIVVDQKSYDAAKHEIDAYAAAVEAQGLKTYILVDAWKTPDAIREKLIALYHAKTSPIEGAVFVGDIPVPMLRDAQHLSSAFKMDQEKYAWNRSSIPSDRFYDDFDLQFTYLKQDTARHLYHYYSLNAASPQVLNPNIYSGRIKPPEGKDKYDKLKAYLKKVVEYKNNQKKVEQIMFFTGHGYNSECPRSWMDEKLAISQQFDYLSGQKSYLEYINFQFEKHIRFRLMPELKRKDLDIALLHHHGGPTTQYLDGMPQVQSVPDEIEDVKYYLRSKLGSAKTPEKIKSTKESYMKMFGVPESWFEGTFDKKQMEKDSTFNANLDINVEDLVNYSSNAKFIMMDACFTGSFHLDDYLTGEYIFDEGQTIVMQANTVNAYQDKWADEMAGLLGLGMRVGFWNQMNCLLETHLIGDPTFAFVSADDKVDVNAWIASKKSDVEFWKKQLTSPYADMQALALRKIYEKEGRNASGLLLSHFKSSKFFTARTEALRLLSLCKDANFISAINLGISDSYELIQRFSAIYMGNTGDESHIPYLIDALLRNNLSKRVEYNLKSAVGLFRQDQLLAELNKQIPQKEFLLDPAEAKAELSKVITYNTKHMQDYVKEVLAKETTKKERYFSLKNFRNETAHPFLDQLINFTDTISDQSVKLTAIEMLGWFDASSQRQKITDFCNRELAKTNLSKPYQNEVLKTKNRVN
ncbi:MAG: hypothetical protein WCI31_11575 [Prolixibacteraceae bacterium]